MPTDTDRINDKSRHDYWAEVIKSYWRQRGASVAITIEHSYRKGGWVIRSDVSKINSYTGKGGTRSD